MQTTAQDALALLAQLTQPQSDDPEQKDRRKKRVENFLREPEAESSPGWFMHVPRRFNDALDIRETEKLGRGVAWTQGSNFSFKPGDAIYDSEKGYCVWSEALQHIKGSICVKSAIDASQANKGIPRNPGYVRFELFATHPDRTKVVSLGEYSLTQDEFVKLLITGKAHSIPEGLFHGTA